MEGFILVVIIIAVLGSIILPILFWGFIIKLFVNHVTQFEKEERKLQALLDQYSALYEEQDISGVEDPQLKFSQHQIINSVGRMRNHFNQMDSLRQQRYETRMGSMMSSVISQGFTNVPNI